MLNNDDDGDAHISHVPIVLHRRKPLLYGQKTKDRACFYSKQMVTNPGKEGMLPERYFDKKHTWIADVCSCSNSFLGLWGNRGLNAGKCYRLSRCLITTIFD